MIIPFVTSNKNKFIEVQAKMKSLGFDVEQIEQSYPEIQSDSLEKVVVTALKWLVKKLGHAVMIEDSGLFIASLDNFPGVYSSYVFKTIGREGILRLLAGERRREAYFETVVGYAEPGKEIHIFKGICSGMIIEKEIGERGFGYDPIFLPTGSERTFAEMTVEEKNRHSHRARALEKFAEFLRR